MTRLPPFSSLLTPEEPLLTDFGTNTESNERFVKPTMGAPKQSPSLRRVAHIISPPVSPQVPLQNTAENEASSPRANSSVGVPDPVLFPDISSKAVPSTESLFSRSSDDLIRYSIKQHLANREATGKSGNTRPGTKTLELPTEDEYMTVISGLASLNRTYNRNPKVYIRAMRAHNDEHWRLIKGYRGPEPVNTNLDVLPKQSTHTRAPRMSRTESSGRIQKPTVTTAKRTTVRRPTAAPATKVPRKSSTPADEKAPPKKKTEDIDFAALPDFSPPISTLDDGRILKTDWTAQPLDLSQDPHRGLLHETEVRLASALRLSCATYLCSKRRIFIARIENLKRGKEFRKTDAQQACKIDVNKASRLWAAYDSVDWLHPRYFQQHLG